MREEPINSLMDIHFTEWQKVIDRLEKEIYPTGGHNLPLKSYFLMLVVKEKINLQPPIKLTAYNNYTEEL